MSSASGSRNSGSRSHSTTSLRANLPRDSRPSWSSKRSAASSSYTSAMLFTPWPHGPKFSGRLTNTAPRFSLPGASLIRIEFLLGLPAQSFAAPARRAGRGRRHRMPHHGHAADRLEPQLLFPDTHGRGG